MKKFLALALVLVFLLSAVSFAAADDSAEPEIPVILPLVGSLYAAEMVDVAPSDDETRALIAYSPATRDDLEVFQVLSAICGIYFLDMELDDTEAYYLVAPGTSYSGYVLLESAEELLCVETPLDVTVASDELIEGILSVLVSEVKLPDNATGNVLPEFHACVGIEPYFTGTMSNVSFAFDGKECWTEWYGDIGSDEMRLYVTYMALFGFGVTIDIIDMDEDGRYNPCVMHFTNGEADILVLYDALEKTANVYYEPGISYTLLGAAELNEALGE